jgi:hypothetical protein
MWPLLSLINSMSRMYNGQMWPELLFINMLWRKRRNGMNTYRFGDKSNRSRLVKLASNYVINCSRFFVWLPRDDLFWIWKLEVWIGTLELEGHWEREALRGARFFTFWCCCWLTVVQIAVYIYSF